jgi:hypothetical protein
MVKMAMLSNEGQGLMNSRENLYLDLDLDLDLDMNLELDQDLLISSPSPVSRVKGHRRTARRGFPPFRLGGRLRPGVLDRSTTW